MSVIELNDVSVTFHEGGRTVEAVKHVNISVEKGEIFGIVGFSGAGKSTLVRTINLLERPTGGHVVIEGNDITALKGSQLSDLRKKIGFIFQGFNLITNVTVGKNIEFALKAGGYPKAQWPERVRELLALVGLENKIDSYPSSLSGGQKQRVSIARALANKPEILLCDEATSALDPKTTNSILDLVQTINKKTGISVIIITHQVSAVERVCDRVAILENGEVAEEGTVSEVFSHPKSSAAKRLVFPEGASEEFFAEKDENYRYIRVVFNGADATDEPMIAQMAVKEGIEASICYASTKSIGGKAYGTMLLAVKNKDDNLNRAINFLTKSEDISAEEVTGNAD